MTDADRIARLEERVTQLEAELAAARGGDLLTAEELARALGLATKRGVETVRRHTGAGRIPVYNLPMGRRYRLQEVLSAYQQPAHTPGTVTPLTPRKRSA